MGRVAVVGAGMLGLSAAFSLWKRGIDFDLFESGAPGGRRPVGDSRIFRHAHDDPRMVELAVENRAVWSRWEEEFGFRLISDGGSVALGRDAIDRLEVMQGIPGLESRALDPPEVSRLLPMMAPYEGPAILDIAGGAIHAQLAVALLFERVADSLIPEQVDSVSFAASGAGEVRTATGTRSYSAVIVCAGTSTPELARSVGTEIPARAEVQVRTTFRLRTPERDGPLACFQDSSGRFGESGIYGGPAEAAEYFSVGISERLPVPEPAPGLRKRAREGSASERLRELAERVRGYVLSALPGLDPRPVGHVPCWTTRLPWAEDGVAVWQNGSVFFPVGHNLFNQAPVLGRELGEAVTSGRVAEYLRPDSRLGARIA